MPRGRGTERLGNGGSRRSPRFPSTSDPKATSSRSTSRLRRRIQNDSYVDQVSDDSGDDFSSHGPSEARRRRTKRKSLDEDFDDERWNRHETSSTRKGEMEVMSSTLQHLPEKSLLELVIDTLQRRDTYEVFGEPVDPNEVGDYYAVVKEPMDFGTMRAKLHEGMYKSLEEFEHDAFLIPKNAMLFNSPSSVYFKQAQAIEELANKSFHLLKNEPEKLKMYFSETRRRSRRLPPEPVTGRRKSGGSTQQNLSTSSSSISHHKQSVSTCVHTDKAFMQSLSLTGVTCGYKDARSTYQPWIYFSRERDSIVSTLYRCSKHLEEVKGNETKMHYKDSLMRFAQGLGPIAQKIAARKLQPQAEPPTCFQVKLQPATFQCPAVSPTQEPSRCHSTLTPSYISSNFPMQSQESFTTAKSAKVWCSNLKQVRIGEGTTGAIGVSIARRGNKIHMGEKGNSQMASAPQSHHGGICLALRSEDTSKGRRNLIGGCKNQPDGTVNTCFVTGFSSCPGELHAINRANSYPTMRTDLSKFQHSGDRGPPTRGGSQCKLTQLPPAKKQSAHCKKK